MIVDIHTQLWDSPRQLGADAVERLRRRARGSWDRPDTSLKAFDDAVVPLDHAVVLGFECRAQGAHISHQQVARYVKRHPGKCLGFAGLDPLGPGCLDSLDEAIALGLVGVNVSPAAGAFHPTHSRAMRLYQRCEERGLPVLFHPGTHFGVASHLEFSRPFLLDEVARNFPRLRIVIAQLGHPWVNEALLLLSKHEHVYADLSLLTQHPWELYNALLAAYQQGGIDRLLLGSDFPFLTPKQAILNIYSVNTFTQGTPLPPVPREQLRGIVERDALACLGIRVPPVPEVSAHPPEQLEAAGSDTQSDIEIDDSAESADSEIDDAHENPETDSDSDSDSGSGPDSDATDGDTVRAGVSKESDPDDRSQPASR